MHGWASSVFGRTFGKMIGGEKLENGFPASEVSACKIFTEERSSSIGDSRGADNAGEGKDADIQGFGEDDGFERKYEHALAERMEHLEKELYDYQYHMGLLLIEKKLRDSEIEELRLAAFASVKPDCTRAQQDQELKSGKESLVIEELKFKLNKMGKQNDVLLAQKNEVEDDKRKIQKDRETLNILYSKLQNLEKELIKKRDLLLSLPQHCKACQNFSIIFNEIDFSGLETLGAELVGDIQNGNLDLFSTTKKRRPSPKKRRGSLKAVVMQAEATLEGILKEIKKHSNGGSENLDDAYEESKMSLVNSDKKEGNGEKQDLLSPASGAGKSSEQANEGHHKRQKTSDTELQCHGQKHYNLRPSTILKVSISQLQKSEHTLLERDSDVDIDYEPSNSD